MSDSLLEGFINAHRLHKICLTKRFVKSTIAKIINPALKKLKATVQGEPFNREVSKILDMLEATNSETEFFFRMKQKYPEELEHLTEEDIQ